MPEQSPNNNNQCSVCGNPLPSEGGECGSCGASGAWQNKIGAELFARERFASWAKKRMIAESAWRAIDENFERRLESLRLSARAGQPVPTDIPLLSPTECWNCRAAILPDQEHCTSCGVPVQTELAVGNRYMTYTSYLVKLHCDEGRLPLSQAHACMNDTKSRVAALRSRMMKDRVVQAEVVEEPKPAVTPPPVQTPSPTHEYRRVAPKEPRPPLWEIILDPRTIQWLLGLGGALLVVGLVIWLATFGIFKNPTVVAGALGLANSAVLGGGWAMIRFTRYQTAGRAITLLACLIMPLNLWFYHANGLVTLEEHLWVAALVCCVLYLASALVLRDQLFVYVFNGGIALTGLLMLVTAGKFWEIASPAVLLVALGIISIHLERAFAEGEGPFSRQRFGRAFFRSGHVLLGAGLLLVLGAQVAGNWLYQPVFEPIYRICKLGPPEIVAETWGQFLALGLVLAGTYAYFYSDLVVRRMSVYVYLAVFTLLWAELLVIELVAVQVAAEAAIIALALTALAANLVQPKLIQRRQSTPLVRAAQPLGLFLSTVPVLIGLLLHLRATYAPLNQTWALSDGGQYHITWLYVLAMFVAAGSCRIGAHLNRREQPWLSSTYFFGTAAATLMGVSGLLTLMGINTWDKLAPLVMIVPIIYIVASRLYRGHSQEKPLVLTGQVATGVMIVTVLAAAMHLTPTHVVEPTSGHSLNILLAIFFAEAALFYTLAAAFTKHGFNVYMATATACGAAWQLLQYNQVGAEYYTLAFAILGMLLLIGYRLAMLEWTGMADAAFKCANALMSLSFVAAALITLSRFAVQRDTVGWSLVALLIELTVLSMLAAWLVQHSGWRRWYIVMAITEAGLTFIALHVLSTLSVWDKLEIFSIVVGCALLVVGHVGWRKEEDQYSDMVSFSLLFGSLAVGLPLAIAVLVHRCSPTPTFSTLNELGMLTAGIVLLTTGFTLQLRSTTIVGAGLVSTYMLTLVLFVNMLENVQTAAIWMMIGGGTIVTAGILLSMYRDRLLTLPARVRRREGVFRVLSWR